MTRRLWMGLLLVLMTAAMTACSGRMVVGGADGGSADGGSADAGLDAGPPDGGEPADGGGALDGGPLDGGPPDGGPPPCSCPPYPTTCTAPAANTPAFTPGARAMATQLFDLIACADDTLQIAMYEGEWPCIAGALTAALERDPDLTIDVVVDGDLCAPGACLFDELDASRVQVVRDTRTGYMHHKWVIADGERVWVSSGNFNERSYCVDHNNAIIVDEPEIVDRYEAIFEGMMGGTFGPIVQPVVTANGFTVYTSPHSPTTAAPDWQTAIIAAIDASETRVEVIMSAFTLSDIADALIRAHERGVSVRLLISSLYARQAPAQAMLAAGIPSRRGNIHDKVALIDDQVFTGSANWSVNARTNNENVLRIEDASVAAAYRADFDATFERSAPVTVAPSP